jgi:diguanylate cyclase (GGDEF)-like protein/PAS domain S-box-containing protein
VIALAASDQGTSRFGGRIPPEVASVVLNATEALILCLDPTGKVVLFNPAAEEATTRLRTEALGREAWRILHPDDAPAFQQAFEDLRTTAIPCQVESRVVTKTGGEVIISWSMRSLVGDGGRMTHAIITGVDVTEQRAAERALAEREAELGVITTTLPIGYFAASWDPAESRFMVRAANDRFAEITGVTPSSDEPLPLIGIAHPDDLDGLRDAVAEVANQREAACAFRVLQPDGLIRWVRTRIAPVPHDDGPLAGCVGWLVDNSAEVRAMAEATRLNQITDEAADLVLILTPAGGVQYANYAARRVATGTLQHIRDLLDEDSATQFFDEVLPSLKSSRQWRGEMAVITETNDKVPVSQVFLAHNDGGRSDGELTHISMIARDISEMKALEHHLSELAFHDPLTGLPNRALVIDRLEQALDRATRSQDFVGVMFLDLDYFKSVNDDLGHDAGDELLRIAAGRLRAALRPADTVSRLGGDEFVVICEGIHDQREAIKVAERIRTTVAKPYTIQGRAVKTSSSIGIALAKNNEIEPKDVISQADTAAYRAKERGRNRYEIFVDEGEHAP